MRNILIASLAALSVWPAAGQSRISPRVATSAGSGYLVQFREGADMGRARQWMAANGFDLIEHPDLLPNHLLATGAWGRLAEVAAGEDVRRILPASVELVGRQRVVACSGAITDYGEAAEYVEVGRGWPKDSSGAVALHYFVESLPGNLDANTARGEIERALREWQKYALLTLTRAEVPDLPLTIAVRFSQREHGDRLPFDGPGGTLAHTYYPAPPNPEPIAGDMHLDAEENWNIGTNIDLYTVVLHEVGHALGLGHSDQPGAVMYPYYRFAYGLTSDDIAGIQDLYGAPSGWPPAGATPPSDPPPPAAPPAAPPAPAPPAPVPPPTPPTAPPTAPMTDRTPPTLRVASPATTIISTTAASLMVSGTAADDTGVVAVKWSSSSGDSGAAVGTVAWSASIPLYVGNTVVTVRAYDAAGNIGWRALTVTRR